MTDTVLSTQRTSTDSAAPQGQLNHRTQNDEFVGFVESYGIYLFRVAGDERPACQPESFKVVSITVTASV